MKRVLILVAGLFMGFAGFAGSEAVAQTSTGLTLENITGGKYFPNMSAV